MRLIEIAFNTKIRVPESWDCFTYRGFLYVKGEDGRFVVSRAWAKVEPTKSSLSQEKRLAS
jgi:hypothetical protein